MAVQLARNDAALHLRCALVDPWGPDLPVEVLEQVSAPQRPRAVNLDGGVDDETGIVEFRATYREGDALGVLHERSRFTRVDRRWCYLDGDVLSSAEG